MYIKTPLLYLLAHHFIIYSSHVLFCSYFHIAMRHSLISSLFLVLIISILEINNCFVEIAALHLYSKFFKYCMAYKTMSLYSLKGSPFALFCLLVLLTKILHCFVHGSLSCPSVNCPVHHSFWLTWPYCPILISLSYVLSGHWMNLH